MDDQHLPSAHLAEPEIAPMSHLAQPEIAQARLDGRRRLARRQRRTRKIRKSVIAGSVAAFATAWVAIGVQLAAGHDPALAQKARSAAKTASVHKPSSTASSSATTQASGSSSSGSSSSGSSSAASQPLAPVTTSQS